MPPSVLTPRPIDGRTVGARLRADASPLQTAAICASGALLSMLMTGSVFGIDNNLFHLPILHKLYDEAQFRDDAFVQSLRYFSSGIWLLLAGGAKYVGDGRLLFDALLFVSRLLTFIGAVCCASLLGIRSVADRLVYCLALCLCSFLQGPSFAGYGSMFVSSFGHSEVANGVILLAIYCAARGQIAWAIACAAITFFINAFMGVWLAAPLAAVSVAALWNRQIAPRQFLTQSLIGGAAIIVLAAPVLKNILANPDFGTGVSFDYAAYLRSYFGAHFFIDANPPYEVVLLLALATLGWLTLSRLQQDTRAFKAALAGMILLYLAGIVVSIVTKDPTILNLHLLRSSVMVHLLTAVSAVALVTQWLRSDDRLEATILGPYFLLALCITFAFPAAAILILFEKPIRAALAVKPFGAGHRTLIFAGLGLALLPLQLWQSVKINSMITRAGREWEAIGAWAKSSAKLDGTFLIPLIEAKSKPESVEVQALFYASPLFEATSLRRIWVDFKRGAAVMWQPSYYPLWRARIDAVGKLKTISETIDYAQANDIGYIIDTCRLIEDEPAAIVFRTKNLCVGEVGPIPDAAGSSFARSPKPIP